MLTPFIQANSSQTLYHAFEEFEYFELTDAGYDIETCFNELIQQIIDIGHERSYLYYEMNGPQVKNVMLSNFLFQILKHDRPIAAITGTYDEDTHDVLFEFSLLDRVTTATAVTGSSGMITMLPDASNNELGFEPCVISYNFIEKMTIALLARLRHT
ncbi:hypothetical protein [Exiguobacterium sp. SH3S1]|uniref:hypothetical protein n=1 Tax=Exiguobacterium sp. SH3S1 TaxID=2510955 RepID=UPI00103D28E5|nr:hypothetical protein [Exiguobacterium sp. SH3S1]TCI60810.1 hypothetical protein EVJ26_11085 [Exiguobacterium sp. SH3S1]